MEDNDHINPTDELTLDTVKHRAVRGIVVLTGRTFVLSAISFVATALLTVFLLPKDFGIFWIVSAIVNFFTFFSDIGLAAALIQSKESPKEIDLRTSFTVQQILVVVLLIILFLLEPIFSNIYKLDFASKMLLYSLGISLLLSSLKTIPSVLLERELQFDKLILPQIIENLIYNIVAVFLAWKGMGITSFSVAVLLRGLVGLLIIYILKPWRPGFAFSKPSFKKLLSFGLPYQANTLLATLKDDGMTAFLGGILGSTGLGFLGWAQKWGQAPLRFFMDHVLKVTFPAFARMQDEKGHVRKSLERSIFFICFLVFPSVVGLLILAPILVQIIPRYEKWSPALLPLVFVSINTVFAAVTTQLTNLLNATGKIKTTFKLMTMWTFLTWLFVPFFSVKYGVNGAAFAYALVGVSSIIPIFIVRKYLQFSLKNSFLIPGFSALLMGLLLLILRGLLPIALATVWLLIIAGVLSYMIISYFILGSKLITDIKSSISIFLNR